LLKAIVNTSIPTPSAKYVATSLSRGKNSPQRTKNSQPKLRLSPSAMALWLCRGFFRVFICNFASRKTLIGGLRFLLCVYKSPFCGLECGIYYVESVKMTKKSIFRDQFSWKVRNFAHVFIEHEFYYCSISQPNCYLERDFMSKSKYTLELRTTAQTSP